VKNENAAAKNKRAFNNDISLIFVVVVVVVCFLKAMLHAYLPMAKSAEIELNRIESNPTHDSTILSSFNIRKKKEKKQNLYCILIGSHIIINKVMIYSRFLYYIKRIDHYY
jgi:prephenate dehydratase